MVFCFVYLNVADTPIQSGPRKSVMQRILAPVTSDEDDDGPDPLDLLG